MHQYDDLLIDVLLDEGFTLAEAERLVAFQKYVGRERFDAQLFQEYQHWVEGNFKSKETDHPKY
jgi:hypothetical protein